MVLRGLNRRITGQLPGGIWQLSVADSAPAADGPILCAISTRLVITDDRKSSAFQVSTSADHGTSLPYWAVAVDDGDDDGGIGDPGRDALGLPVLNTYANSATHGSASTAT